MKKLRDVERREGWFVAGFLSVVLGMNGWAQYTTNPPGVRPLEGTQYPAGSYTNYFVVSRTGNDQSAKRTSPLFPFASLTNAIAKALPGDTIVVLPGNYTNYPSANTNSINLLKNGVNWHFQDGANIYQVATNANHSMFNDGHNWAPNSLAITSSISGKGSFYMLTKSTTEEIDTPAGLLELWNSNSVVHFEFKTAADFGQNGFPLGAGVGAVINVHDCQYVSVRGDDITANSTGGGGVYWVHGDCDVEVQRIVVPGGWAVYSDQDTQPVSIWPPRSLYVRAGLISGLGGVWCYSNGATNRTWVTAQEIKATGSGNAVLQQGAYLYIQAEKIGTASTSFPTIMIDAGPTALTGERTWITAQKVEGSYRWLSIANTGSNVTTNWISVQHFDGNRENGVPPIGIETMAGSTARTFVAGQFAKATGQTFVSHNAGTLVVQGFTVEAQTAAIVAGSGLHMKGCTLVCSGANSITAASAQTMGIYWTAANVTTNGNMTFSPNAGFTVNANVY